MLQSRKPLRSWPLKAHGQVEDWPQVILLHLDRWHGNGTAVAEASAVWDADDGRYDWCAE